MRATPEGAGPDTEYILPLRWAEDSGVEELAAYISELATWTRVTVVDGSPAELFARHRVLFPASVRHLPPDATRGGNGKVAAVLTAVRRSTAERLVIADDDVRYTREGLAEAFAALDDAELVRPQNYFAPLPWHARWDTARTLINRAFAGDFPGTLAVRRSALAATDGYAGVLFENLELIRTVTAAGGREKQMPALLVARRPPTSRHFFNQLVRQAYDDFAQPARLFTELAALPVLAVVLAQRRVPRALWVLALAGAAVGIAEIGRRRDGGTAAFPADTVLFAPLWVLERAVCVWLALALRAGGGVPYAGARIKTAAHSQAALRCRHGGKIQPVQGTHNQNGTQHGS
ncbi:glycosyltransferase [Arthrobacter globiformis]|uniref:glycosyltransferase n=1 Tax=Arthrobacter globiformis TaxID=1665 RepID=UPI00167CC7A0|nr:glycosyltransferase family 2 protein [Arthrobacter globiformis]